MTAATKPQKRQKNKKYEEVIRQTENISPYTFNELLFHVGHADFTTAVIESLKTRKDFDALVVSAVLRSGRFWFRIILVILAISILPCVLFYFFPRQASHVMEKTVNSRIPGLLPPA